MATPSQIPLLTADPPAGFPAHSSTASSLLAGDSNKSLKLISSGRATLPSIFKVQVLSDRSGSVK
jgi:hypothetical protein